MNISYLIIFTFFCLSIILFFISNQINSNVNKIRKKSKIPKGKITYSDLNKPAKPFFSKKYMIAGKPDYIISSNNTLIPVEFKTSSSNKPHLNHKMQLAAYCHLIEENYGGFVPYGIIVYNKENMFEIPFDPKVRFELENNINHMRQQFLTKNIQLNHNDSYKCQNCSMKKYCDKKLM